MAKELVVAKMQLKDENGNAILDDEGKVTYNEASAEYDFGDNLDSAVELCGADTVYSNYRANSKVALQGVMRNLIKAGKTPDEIQSAVDGWKPGLVMEKVTVDPKAAFAAAFMNYPLEKKLEMLRNLGVPEDALAAMAQ